MLNESSTGSATTRYLTCPQCGSIYLEGQWHNCPMASGTVSPVDYRQWNGLSPIFFVDAETKHLLDRIAIALEKLVGIR